MGTLLLILGLFGLFVVGSFVLLAVTGRLDRRAARDEPGEPGRPRWGNPLAWVGVCAVFAILGLVVAPRLLGGVFLFLPFVWVGRRGRGRGNEAGRRS